MVEGAGPRVRKTILKLLKIYLMKKPDLQNPSAKTVAIRKHSVSPAQTLSEAEIRSMPASDYMNDAQLDFFRRRLIGMREEMLSREEGAKERLHQNESHADPADRATAEEEHFLDLRLRERESLLLRKIDESLRLIHSRDYGYCAKTGEPIGIPRLLVRPTATVCIDVKDRDEKLASHSFAAQHVSRRNQ
jgi:DnaK suppressor protein